MQPPHPQPSEGEPDQLCIETHVPERGTVIVAARGEVDIASAPVLSEALDCAIDPRDHQLVVDLNEVTFMDATIVGLLVQARQRAARAGATITIRCDTDLGRLLFTAVRLENLLH